MSPSEIDLLLVDDEVDFRSSAERYFNRCGYRVQTADSGAAALAALSTRQFDVAVVDVHMPEMDGVQLLEILRESDPALQVIMLTGGATVPTAVASMKAGAVDYVTKPIKLADLDHMIQKTARTAKLQRENEHLRQALSRNNPRTDILGDSPAIKKLYHLIQRIAPSDKPVLIQGESGTGKELVARALHAGSHLAEKPLVVINCAAIPESLLESELFGYEKGAFTSASTAKPGLFEIADGGTLFIDEFGELAGGLQAKLLRVLEDGVIRRLGSVKERRVQTRLIAATNKDLRSQVQAGKFREDLYYRVNVLGISLPPLRERKSDIGVLTEHFLNNEWTLQPEARLALEAYDWPGNVRQLRNVLERAKVLADQSGEIALHDLPPEITEKEMPSPCDSTDGADLVALNRAHVLRVLTAHEGNKTKTAHALGITRRSLYRLLDKFGV